jgi:hypothetical protein
MIHETNGEGVTALDLAVQSHRCSEQVLRMLTHTEGTAQLRHCTAGSFIEYTCSMCRAFSLRFSLECSCKPGRLALLGVLPSVC